MLSHDLCNDPAVLLGETYAAAGVRSLAVLPLIVSGEAIGAFALYSSETDFFHEEELKLLTELTDDIAFAIVHVDRGDKLRYLAHFDPLTGLANQALFLDRLRDRLNSATDSGSMRAVLVLDIERFKSIGDAFGREAGDTLLRQIAERLVKQGGGDARRFARLGADRFAVLSPPLDGIDEMRRYLAQRDQAVFHDSFRVGANDVRIFVKIGLALFPEDGIDADTLLRNAEAALKKAKASGERYLFFNPKMTAHVAERLSLENRLRHALDNGEFMLHYQPKVSLATGKVTGAEA